MPIDIRSELSAIASSPPARSLALAASVLAPSASKVADVGCGFMQGTKELLKYHNSVYAIDTVAQQTRIAGRITECEAHPSFSGFRSSDSFSKSRLRLHGAYVVNVLHTLPTVKRRVELLEAVRRNLTAGGFVVVDVPYYEWYYKKRMVAENAYKDGFVFSHGAEKYTFYRFTTIDELDQWAAAAGFAFDFRLTTNHHWIRVYRPA